MTTCCRKTAAAACEVLLPKVQWKGRDPPRACRQSSSTPGASSSARPPHPAGPGSRPRSRPPPTHPPATHRPSSRVRCHSSGDSRVEELVDVMGGSSQAGEPTTAPPIAHPHPHALFRSTLISATRPKSSYHPLGQPDPPMSLPPAPTCHASLPPPLLPVSLPPLFLPTHRSEAMSLEPHQLQPQPGAAPVLDEAVLSQMRLLQVYGSDQCLAGTPASHLPKGQLPHHKKGNLHQGKGKQGVASSGGDVPLPQGTMKASGSTVQVKDEAKNNPVPSISSMDNPFLTVDPFPPVTPQSPDKDVLFLEETQAGHPSPAPSGTRHNHRQAFSDNFTPEADQKNSLTPKVTQDSLSPLKTQSLADNLGDSILEALDFAVAPAASGHKRVSPQHSRERRTTRAYSEENLLDSSHNTFEAILRFSRDSQDSRAYIIEEFDPLLTSHVPQDHKQDEEKMGEEVCDQKESDAWREKEREATGPSPPKLTPRTTLQSSRTLEEDTLGAEGEGDVYGSPPDYYAEGGAVALEEEEEEGGVGGYCTTGRRHPGAPCLAEGVKGRTSYASSEDSSSMYSWPSDYTARTLSSPASSVYPCLYPEEEEEDQQQQGEEEAGVDVGRSAFYLPPTTQHQGEAKRRTLLNIREGVKIYFIHTDSVVTSPWKRPFLAVSRDPSKDQLLGAGLVVSVGHRLWECELHKKSTLVLRTQTGGYVFNEVAGKPECKAVAIRVPSGVRHAQQELLTSILQQNTLLEEERPKGITKAISKGATSAATRMSRLVEGQSMTPSNTFVRRNSIRALKGVTKRLTSIAEKTGGTLKELPEEYETLQEAADTLAFAQSAKMIQYV